MNEVDKGAGEQPAPCSDEDTTFAALKQLADGDII